MPQLLADLRDLLVVLAHHRRGCDGVLLRVLARGRLRRPRALELNRDPFFRQVVLGAALARRAAISGERLRRGELRDPDLSDRVERVLRRRDFACTTCSGERCRPWSAARSSAGSGDDSATTRSRPGALSYSVIYATASP
jgi:hypothetical protein